MPFDGEGYVTKLSRAEKRALLQRLPADDQADLVVLRKALRDLRKRDNWIKGSFGSYGHPRCAVGHLQSHANPTHAYQIAGRRLAPVIGWSTDAAVIKWNDSPARQKRDVVSVFQQAIARLEARALALPG